MLVEKTILYSTVLLGVACGWGLLRGLHSHQPLPALVIMGFFTLLGLLVGLLLLARGMLCLWEEAAKPPSSR